jgi:hypothetical protein
MNMPLVAFLSSFLAWGAVAARVTRVPTINLVTVHGGYLKDGSADRICITGGLQNLPVRDGGVRCAYHQFSLHLQNLSPITQTVTVTIHKGSSVTSKNSNGEKEQSPSVANPNPVTTSSNYESDPISIPGNGDALYQFGTTCNHQSCMIFEKPSHKVASAGPAMAICDRTSTAPEQVCLDLNTFMNVSIKVSEDAGAVLASISTLAHRAFGFTDHFLTPPPAIVINGGRPF